MPLLIPNVASTISSPGAVPSSSGKVVWLGLQTLSTSGSAGFYAGTASVSGCEIFSISLSPQSQVLFGPLEFPTGVYVGAVSGACALVMMRK